MDGPDCATPRKTVYLFTSQRPRKKIPQPLDFHRAIGRSRSPAPNVSFSAPSQLSIHPPAPSNGPEQIPLRFKKGRRGSISGVDARSNGSPSSSPPHAATVQNHRAHRRRWRFSRRVVAPRGDSLAHSVYPDALSPPHAVVPSEMAIKALIARRRREVPTLRSLLRRRSQALVFARVTHANIAAAPPLRRESRSGLEPAQLRRRASPRHFAAPSLRRLRPSFLERENSHLRHPSPLHSLPYLLLFYFRT